MEYEGAVDFWSKPKIFFLLLTAIYIMYSVGVRDIKGVLYFNSKLTTYERFEIKQRSHDFERDCGSDGEGTQKRNARY